MANGWNSPKASWDWAIKHLLIVTLSTQTSAAITHSAWISRRVFSRPALELVKLTNCLRSEGWVRTSGWRWAIAASFPWLWIQWDIRCLLEVNEYQSFIPHLSPPPTRLVTSPGSDTPATFRIRQVSVLSALTPIEFSGQISSPKCTPSAQQLKHNPYNQQLTLEFLNTTIMSRYEIVICRIIKALASMYLNLKLKYIEVASI